MDKTEVITKLKRYKKLLSQYMSFDKMILFGSYARGSQREDSDVDVAIIVDEMQGDYFSTRPLLWRVSVSLRIRSPTTTTLTHQRQLHLPI